MKQDRIDSIFWGVLIVLIGGLFLWKNLHADFDVLHTLWKYWPAALILIGVKNIILFFTSRK